MQPTSIKQLMDAGAHFGHRTYRWNPKMKPFIHSVRSGIHIIDLDQTRQRLDEACNFMRRAARNRKQIVFVGTKKQASETVREEARRCGVHYVDIRWLGGMLTNFETIRLSIKRCNELQEMIANGELFRRPKKEQAALNRELFSLEKHFGGLKTLRGRPEIVFIIDQQREKIAVTEANKLGIKVVGIVDTNGDPDGIDYVIPGNDDSIRSIQLITRRIADAILGDDPDDFPNDGGPDLQPSGVPRQPLPTIWGSAIALPFQSNTI